MNATKMDIDRIELAFADADYVLQWMKACRDFGLKGIPDNIIGLQEQALRFLQEYDQGKHPLPKDYADALERSRPKRCAQHDLLLDKAGVCAISSPVPCDSRRASRPERASEQESWLNEFHRINVARQHEAFAPAHSLLGLIACVAEEVGELSGAALGVTGEKKRKLNLTNDDMLDAVADAITYLSLVADRCGCSDLQKMLGDTFNMVSDRAGSKMKVSRAAHASEPWRHDAGNGVWCGKHWIGAAKDFSAAESFCKEHNATPQPARAPKLFDELCDIVGCPHDAEALLKAIKRDVQRSKDFAQPARASEEHEERQEGHPQEYGDSN